MTRSLLTTMVMLWALSVTSGAFSTNAFVVVNAPAGSSIDQASLEALLTGQRRNWDAGEAAKVVLPSRESSNFDFVAQKLFGTSGQVMQRLWFRLVFSGRANAPDYVDSSLDVIEAVERQDGALGILVSDVAPTVREGLTIVELK
ncbi:MAG: hypothetical protein GWP37_11315 [Gammaproteobacteria bacterium]|nr:hypothetical protein [Gammaproteobacteria bacterium]